MLCFHSILMSHVWLNLFPLLPYSSRRWWLNKKHICNKVLRHSFSNFRKDRNRNLNRTCNTRCAWISLSSFWSSMQSVSHFAFIGYSVSISLDISFECGNFWLEIGEYLYLESNFVSGNSNRILFFKHQFSILRFPLWHIREILTILNCTLYSVHHLHRFY